jgi:TPR repeat protein
MNPIPAWERGSFLSASGLRKAAEQGQAEGQMMPGNLYCFSLGADLDP